jgi:2-dehydro-3-deoxygalactonokinase
MYFATMDCGTTNSRVFIINERRQVVGRGAKRIGVRDTAISGSNEILREGLKELFEDTLRGISIRNEDVQFIVSSGMITSEIGLLEVPHVWAPASVDELAENIRIVRDNRVFPVGIPLVLIPGVKNLIPKEPMSGDLRKVDFMRGEETQVAGFISQHKNINYPIIITVLSSHTKFIYVDEDRRIMGCITTMSGQIYEAIKSATSIGKSIQKSSGNEAETSYFNESLIDIAYNSVNQVGFLRSIMMPRYMEVLLDTKWYERELFLDATIASEDLKAMNDFPLLGFDKYREMVLVGNSGRRCDLFAYLLKEKGGLNIKVRQIFDEDEVQRLSIDGSFAILEKSNFLRR